MDNLLFIVGIVVIVISTLMIITSKKTGSEKSIDIDYTESTGTKGSYKDELGFTDEEVEFISTFENRASKNGGRPEDFESSLEKSSRSRDLEDQAREYDDLRAGDKVEASQDTDRKEAIAILFREGMTSAEIAKKLEMGRREVDIILKVKGLIK